MMKKLIFMIVFLFVIIGCEKDKPRCWFCTQVMAYAMPGFLTDTIITTATRCDLTKEQINDFEHENTYHGQECYNGYVIEIQSSMHCMEATCWTVRE